MIVGLTGGIATGKTTVTNQLLKDGFVVVDADDITHQLYRENKDLIEKIKTFFPEAVENGVINRQTLARYVIQNPALMTRLDFLTHGYIVRAIQDKMDELSQTNAIVILSAPLLFETGMYHLCEKVIGLYADLTTQYDRALMRSGMTSDKLELLISKQWANHQREVLSDLWVSTDTPFEETYQTVLAYLRKLEKSVSKSK